MDTTEALVFSPHPDDAEMGCGGTIASLSHAGHSVALCYITRGEMGTRGDVETRAAETREALQILGVLHHVYADIPDAGVTNTQENRLKIVAILRTFRPRIVLTPHHESLHPDHVQASLLIRDAIYLSGLMKIETGQERYRPESVFYYPLRPEFTPSLVVDITGHFGSKMNAIRAYRSQFYDPATPNAPETLLSVPDFLDRLAAIARYYGALIGVTYGEGYGVDFPLALPSPTSLLGLSCRMR